MNDAAIERIEDLGRDELAEFLVEMLHRSWMHYGLWFNSAGLQMEPDRFGPAERQVFRAVLANNLRRLGQVFGFAVDERGLPARVAAMDRAELAAAVKALAVNWYAADGMWFQALEGVYDMDLAKRANDSVWARYAPYEAQHIRLFLGLPAQCGLGGLRAALPLRSAALLNAYAYEWEPDGSLVLRVADCRIQAARRRRGLPDYPCKSAGLVEQAFFARALDPRITTQCLACPPDEHPDQWCCAWRFGLEPAA